MLRDEVARGVRDAAELVDLRPEQVDSVATAITSEALSDAAGRHALTLDPRGGIVFFDVFKAVTATAGILAAVGTAASGVTITAILAAIGALNGLQGFRQPLPRSCGQVVAVLLEGRDKTLTQPEMRRRFAAIYDGPPAADGSNLVAQMIAGQRSYDPAQPMFELDMWAALTDCQ